MLIPNKLDYGRISRLDYILNANKANKAAREAQY